MAIMQGQGCAAMLAGAMAIGVLASLLTGIFVVEFGLLHRTGVPFHFEFSPRAPLSCFTPLRKCSFFPCNRSM
jgi:hypothetical protein